MEWRHWVYETLSSAKNLDHIEVAGEIVAFRVEPLKDLDIYEYSHSQPLTYAKVMETTNSSKVFTKGFYWIT